MDKNTIHSSSTNHQDSNSAFTNHDSTLELPPPYSPTQRQSQQSIPSSPANTQQDNLLNDCQSSTASNPQPSAPSLYPEIPQRLPYGHYIQFPIPQPYNQHSQQQQYQQHQQPPQRLYQDATVSSPLYKHAHQIGYQQQQQQLQQPCHGQHGAMYGSTQDHSAHVHPPPPVGFHTIYISGHQTSPAQAYRLPSSTNAVRRSFPVGALVFIFGWAFPPLWILGACCCAASRNPYEAWWARLNLIMGLLLLLSSLIYSMLAVLAGDWYVGLQWINLYQEA